MNIPNIGDDIWDGYSFRCVCPARMPVWALGKGKGKGESRYKTLDIAPLHRVARGSNFGIRPDTKHVARQRP